MREILFRGVSEVTDEWVYGYLVITRIKGNEYFSIVPYDDLAKTLTEKRWFQVIPETVGQFTGMFDGTKWEQLTKEEQSEWLKKHTIDEWNGRMIFEGDIVDCWSEGINAQGAVRQRIDGLWIIYPAWQNQQFWGLCPNRNGSTSVKIIGNIHDNPEQLKGGT